ncbi:MAG TPA: hypothetical protein VM661_10310 [Candidatus Sulfotelmatobacter sp.]|nr:hypothetical protein [Candidatus Sulfotelmatobacter sp.]
MFDGPANASLSASVSSAQIPPSYSPVDDEHLSSAYSDVREIDQQADTVAALAAQDTQRFAQFLSDRLNGIGTRTGRAIIFAILPDGSVGVVGAHTDKVKLEQLFQDDRDLFQQFHQVARQNDMVASAEVCRRYLEDSYNAHGESARMAVWRRYRALCDQMESMAGRLILAGGQLLSGALQFTHTALAQQ